ncbi:TetR/AcrR family transcriptional regulator [Kribbella turkmenica]|uniref:TetR/AcrR family transcriptional regulator n=1 Tax=Kribbella turkmenica TaxID=2530375 RepID=A0A4V2YHE0_9ACTN|nr:TetR/AcrR family transcriptional regulator [Kribbella turkmenica]TDD30497.1 TetR/AcrR family transcriptional regulator [Kribbella turkmenica]
MGKRAESRERNRVALIEAARELILRDGARCHLDAIVTHAGLTTGAVYSIFGSKQALLVAVFDEIVADVQDSLQHVEDPALELDDVLRGCARAFYSMATHPAAPQRFNYELVLFELAQSDADIHSRLLAARRSVGDHLAKLLTDRVRGDEGTRPTSVEEAGRLAIALQALLHGLTQTAILAPDAVGLDLFEAAAAALGTLQAAPASQP